MENRTFELENKNLKTSDIIALMQVHVQCI